MRCGCGRLWAIEQPPIPSLSQPSHTCPSPSFAKSALRNGSAISHLALIHCFLYRIHLHLNDSLSLWDEKTFSSVKYICHITSRRVPFAIGAGNSPLLRPSVRQSLNGHLPLPKCTQTRKKNFYWIVAAISCYGLLCWAWGLCPNT